MGTLLRPRVLAPIAVVLVLAGVVMAIAGAGDSSTETAPASSTTTSADEETSTTSTTRPTTTTSTTAPVATTTTARPGVWTCPPLPARRSPDPARPRYTVRVDANPSNGIVEGDVTVRFTPDLPVSSLVFRLWPNGPRPAAAGTKLTVGAATSEGRTLDARRPDATTLELLLGRTLSAGRTVEVSMPWRLEVPGSAPDRVSRSGDSLRLGSFLPLLAWQPGLGWARHPATSLFAEATTTPAADWSVAITVPSGYGVLASGERGSNGRWTGTGLRDFAISVGRFELARATAHAPNPVMVTVGAHAGTGEDPQAYLRRVVASLEDFGTRFGAYPWPTYTLAITPGLEGGIEYPTHVMQGPGTVGRTTSHEVAHMWFYALVGNSQAAKPWIDEGLASYGEARFEGTLDDFRTRSIPPDARGRAGSPMTYWESHRLSYYRGVYVQGAVGVAALGSPDQVDCALRHVVARHAYRIATADDILSALRVVFPDARARLAPFGLP